MVVITCAGRNWISLYLDTPHFAVWLRLYIIDSRPLSSSTFHVFSAVERSTRKPPQLHRALWISQPGRAPHCQESTACECERSYYVTSQVAALERNHIQIITQLLHPNGADTSIWGYARWAPLNSATGQEITVQMRMSERCYSARLHWILQSFQWASLGGSDSRSQARCRHPKLRITRARLRYT